MTATRLPTPLGTTAKLPEPFRETGQRIRLVWRVLATLLVTLPAAAIQTVLLRVPGDAKRSFARVYWASLCWIMAIERRVIGTPVAHSGRPLLFVSNHTSWLDVLALGGTLRACFVAKAEVGTWPGINIIAKLGRTVFVSRKASDIGRERDDMRSRMADGDDLILFPEGTSSDGARTLPFRSAFFAVAEARDGAVLPLIQPVSIVYDRIDFLPVGRTLRPVSSWYGDMDLGHHFLRLAAVRQMRATILLHPPIDPADYPSRKELSRAVWHVVAMGAAEIRQNRPPRPVATSDSLDSKPADKPRVQPVEL